MADSPKFTGDTKKYSGYGTGPRAFIKKLGMFGVGLGVITLNPAALGLGAVGLLLGWGGGGKRREKAQIARDERAILNMVRSISLTALGWPGHSGGVLYLRAFESTNTLRFVDPDYYYLSLEPAFGNPRRSQLEHMEQYTDIEQALAFEFPELICLGRPGEHIGGAGRVDVPDSDWQSVVEVLAFRASNIFFLPYSAAGTLWEIEHVFNSGLHGKVVWIMPPAQRKSDNDLAEKATHWATLNAEMRSRLGIEMPAYHPEGLLFVVNPDRRSCRAEKFPMDSYKGWRIGKGHFGAAHNRLGATLAERRPPPELKAKAAAIAQKLGFDPQQVFDELAKQ